jgi:polyisoprenoid-binding protein YceI
MTKFLFSAVLVILALNIATAQSKYITKDAKVVFDASSPLEPIKATNSSGGVALDASTGDVVASVQIKNFIFKQALMQEHFNENYMESTKYPKATLTGKIANFGAVKLGQDGTYNTKINGTLDMHGVKKTVEVPATITVKSGSVSFSSQFKVLCADYGIAIPSVVADKVAKEVKINVDGTLAPK